MKALLAVLFATTAFASSSPKFMSVQSFPGKVKIDVDLNMSAGAAVDVLFVVDNSGSMYSHQQHLAAHVPVLVQDLINSGVDFHAGVVTTDMEAPMGGPSLGWLVGRTTVVTPSTPLAANVLTENILVGVNGSGNEMLFTPITAALTEPLLSGANAGFYRPGAQLAIVFLSDAEDHSTMLPADLDTFLTQLKGDRHLITVQGLIAPSAEPACQPDDSTVLPMKVEALLNLYGGHIYSLCAANFVDNIHQITATIAANLGAPGQPKPGNAVSRIPLPSKPDFQSIQVTYGTQVLGAGDLHGGWTYDASTQEVILGDQIVWSDQAPGTPLEVVYVPEDWTK